jgi:uncharacterized protein
VNFENTFTVPASAGDVWAAMMDFERVAPCMPGAEVTERTGEEAFKVQVRVKVGPMSMTYRGQAEITDRDDAARSAAMRVQARETRGQGSANATVQMRVAEEGAGTRATMTTELKLSGRAAAMGRGVITDVSQALVSEFADNLARMLSQGQGDGASGSTTAPQSRAGGPASTPEPSAPPAPPGAPGPPPPAAGPSHPAPGPSHPAPAPPPPPSVPPPPSNDALDAGQLARSVVASRFREPRTVLSAAGLLALLFLAVGFRLGRRFGRR